jgi:hypothetical protein
MNYTYTNSRRLLAVFATMICFIFSTGMPSFAQESPQFEEVSKTNESTTASDKVHTTNTIVEAFGGASNTAVMDRLHDWTLSAFSLGSSRGINNSRRLTRNFWASSPQNGSIETPTVEAGTDPILRFSYNIRNNDFSAPGNMGSATAGDHFDIRVEVKVNAGSYIEIDQIQQSNHDAVLEYQERSYDLNSIAALPAIASSDDITVKISNTRTSSGDYWLNFDNFVLGTVTPGFIYGKEGWRIIASPNDTATLDDLFSNMWLQGIAGSDFDGPTVEANVKKYAPSSGYEDFNNASDAPGRGNGFVAFIYSDDDRDLIDDNFPKVFNLSGTAPTSGVFDTGIETGWNIVGNPYGVGLDLLSGASGSGYDTDFFFWDATANDGDGIWVSTENDVPEQQWFGRLGVYEGFWVEATDPAPTLELNPNPTAPRPADDSPRLDKKNNSLYLSISNGDLVGGTGVVFSKEEDIDSPGSSYMAPLRSRMIELFHKYDDETLMSRRVASEITDELSLPVGLFSTESGMAELSWRLPDNYDESLTKFYLFDRVTGERHPMTEGGSISIDLGGMNMQTESGEAFEAMAIPEPDLQFEGEARFDIIISPVPTSTGAQQELPERLALHQNYPNPFNPTTQINYELPESADVRLDVFNVQGQRVATLVNSSQSAGSYNVNFDASNLASGVYLYRLQTGAEVITRTMTLIK